MNYFWITLRGFAFWFGALHAFMLAWSPLVFVMISPPFPAAILLVPVAALIFGAVLPDKALVASPGMQAFLCIVLTLGLVGLAIGVVDDSLQQNTPGLSFRIAGMALTASLFFLVILVRKPKAQPPAR